MAEIEGIQLKITSDGSQAVREFSKIRQAFDKIREIETSQKKALAEAFNIPNITKIAPAVDNAKKYGQQLLDNINKSAEALNTIGKQFEATFGAMFKSISAGATAVAGAISFITKNALNIGGGFEAQMTNVKIISGATAEELEKLTAKAREMGAALPISAKDAAQAMELLAQRGTKAKDILVTVADVSALAISQNVDMASAADLLGSTMTNFGIALDDASKVTDIFNNACNQSALSMAKIINAMKYVGPSAGAVKMQLTEAVSALEVLTNAGLTGEMAGAGLALVLNKLAGQSHVMGVEVNNLDGSMRSLKDIFSELQKKGFSLAEATALFGMRGNKVALALANYAYTLEDNEKNLQKWGATQNAVTEKMKTWINIWNSFQSASEELHIEVFEQIKNQAKDSVNAIAELTREFSKWIGETKIAGDTLNAFLEGLGFSVPSISDFQSLLRNFNVQSFLDNVKSFGAAIKGIADSIVWAFDMIKVPLGFLIEHLGAFATISFWGWIVGKGLQVPAAIIGIATSMKQLYSASKMLLSLSWGALMTPLGATLTAAGILTVVVGSKVLEARKAEQEFNDTIERIQQEIKDADADLKLHIDAGEFITGFEKLPESFFKANDELRKNTLDTVKALQSEFRDKYAKAVDFVAEKFPNLAADAVKAGIDIEYASNETIQQITNALHGGEDEFKKLSPFLQAIVEQINLMDIYAGKGSEALLEVIKKIKEVKQEVESLRPENKLNTFFEESAANLRNVLENIPAQIDEANKYLKGTNGQLAITVSLKQAQEALNKFVKEAASKYAIPEDIVKQSLFDRLKNLAIQGNKTAKSLYEAWGNVYKRFNDFFDSAKDAINYLGDSPNQFVPALQSMLNGIQKIDPVTGKLTEKFKKAHDVLKEWANVTFDNLTNRIQKLRKAVEGGFIDKSVLEKELKDSLPQLKLQVISELEPTRGQFKSQSAYEATVASDLVAKVIDLFGEAGQEFVQKIYQGMTGTEIGKAILRDNQRDLTGNNGTTAYINGIEQVMTKSVHSIADSIGALNYQLNRTPQQRQDNTSTLNISGGNLNEAIRSISEKTGIDLREVANIFGEKAGSVAEAFKSNFATVNSSIQVLNDTISNNSNVISRTGDSMLGLINSIHTPSSNSNVYLKDYSSEFDAVIKAIDNINSSAQANISAVNVVGEAVKAIQVQPVNEDFLARAIANAINPILTAQTSSDSVSVDWSSLATYLDALRKSTDNNTNAIDALRSAVTSSLVEMSNGNNINEEALVRVIVNGITPMINALDKYQFSTDSASANMNSLAGYLEGLRKSNESNVTAMGALQSALTSSSEAMNFSAALAPLVNAVQNLDNALNAFSSRYQDNSKTVDDILAAVRDFNSALSNLNSGNTFNIEIQQQGFSVGNKYDADYLAKTTAAVFRSGLGNGGM